MATKQPTGTLTVIREIKCRNGFRFTLSLDDDKCVYLSFTDPDGRWASISDVDGVFEPSELTVVKEFFDAFRTIS